MTLVNYRNNFFAIVGLLLALLGGLLYFNISTIAANGGRAGEIAEIQAQIADAQGKIGNIAPTVMAHKKKLEELSSLAPEYNSEIEYLASLEILNTLSKKHNVRIDEILPRLENTLSKTQSELTDATHTVERYPLDLRVDGRFLNIGRLLDDLGKNGFAVRNLEIRTKANESNVQSDIGLYSYRLIAK